MKTKHKETIDSQAHGRLTGTDWYALRKADAGTAVPSAVTTYRAAVRTAADSMKTKIDAVSDVDALAALYAYSGSPLTRPLGEWPDPVS